MTIQDQYHELSFYTLAHPGNNFIHQHIVDAYAAQTANEKTKRITVFFSLAGLYLYIIKNYTGRQVQLAHMKMAKKPKDFEEISLPATRGAITVTDVVAIPPGPARDDMIRQWCMSVWAAFSNQQEKIILLTEKFLTN